jgi:hypothetical protein
LLASVKNNNRGKSAQAGHQDRGGSQPAISCKRQEDDRSSKTRGHGAARGREVNDCRNSRDRRKCDAPCERTSASGCGTK